MSEEDRELKRVVREGIERACSAFTERVAPLGFARTRAKFWSREGERSIDFIHLHVRGSSYGGPIHAGVTFRVHLGARALDDGSEALALNGPHSDVVRVREGRYHLSFNARSGSEFDRCCDDLERFVVEQGEPWFQEAARSNQGTGSGGAGSEGNLALSRKLLGIKPR